MGMVGLKLGIRVAFIGQSGEQTSVAKVLEQDPDVFQLLRWEIGEVAITESQKRIDVIIAEPCALEQTFSPEQLSLLRSAVLIVSLGVPRIGFPISDNLEHSDADESFAEIWPRIKYKAVTRRVGELKWLYGAMVQETPIDELGQAIQLETTNGAISLSASAIDWARAAGSYLELCAKDQKYVVRLEMYRLEAILPNHFVRIHRRLVVNLARVIQIERSSTSLQCFARLASGERFPISRDRLAYVRQQWQRYRRAESLCRIPETICEASVRSGTIAIA